ncbi:MAG: peptidase [Candidatus Muiribacterium halophilum]|uniref:Peptidase n=1 Tax=Muiribacterium halophilum TaxID=2053465 RepID=A0A2N5ZL62_MUIH1|nr:MAG: peptidase [Candidatus Muirbacterium halophilum]
MKIYISLDMEGIAGTYNWNQERTGYGREEVVKNMQEQMEWIIQAIHESEKNSQITKITIADSHSGGDNLTYKITELDSRINLISGGPRVKYMMPGLDDTYDQIFFVGYHSGIGNINGAMDHTYSGSCIHNIWIDDIPMNEGIINAYYGGYFNIPTTVITGDKALREELKRLKILDDSLFVETKEAVGRFASASYSKDKVKRDTFEKVKEALSDSFKLPKINKKEKDITLKIELAYTSMADCAELIPSAKRIDGRTVEIVHSDYGVILDSIMAIVLLAQGGK